MTYEERTSARLWAEAPRHWPVVLAEDPESPPTKKGESWYFTSPGGQRRIAHPGSYGWPMRYHRSTYRVEVGERWLAQHPVKFTRKGGIPMWIRPLEKTIIHGIAVTPGWLAVHYRSASLVVRGKDVYHSPFTDPREAVRDAINGWRRQRKERAEKAALVTMAPKIWVTEADSIASGNCALGTWHVAREIAGKLGAPAGSIGAVRADFLLSIRNDAHVQRAIAAAGRRAGLL